MGAVKSAYSKQAYMLYYIERKDYDNISKLLDQHPELIEMAITEKTKMTPLVRACFNGNTQMVKYFVQKCEANVNTITEIGQTAIIVATRRYNAEIVRYLLSRGADVNIVTPIGLSALEYAILPGFYQIALLIFERIKDKELRTPEEYQEIASNYHYRYVNYQIFIEQLQNRVEIQNVPDFLKKEKRIYKDPVIDPRESWKEWTMRQIEFKDPPLVEREELPEELQPQNQKFGKIKHFFKNLTMSPMVAQKPKFLPETKSAIVPSANELNRSDPRTLENIQTKSIP